MPFSPRAATVVAALAASSAIVPAVAHGASIDDDRSVVAGSTPTWAAPAAKVGAADESAVRHIQVALSLRDLAGAERLVKGVSTPGSPQRGQYLTNEQFTARFGPTEDTVARVQDWLKRNGVSVTGISANRHFVDAEATTKTLEGTFGTKISAYRTEVGGRPRTLTSPESPITVPRVLRSVISAVIGLDDSSQVLRPQHTTPHETAAQQHCARWWGEQNNTDVPQKYPSGYQSNSLCGYSPASLRAMYGLDTGNSGSGTTVGIVGAYNSDTIVNDTNQAAAQFGMPPLKAGQYTTVLPSGGYTDQQECGADGWNGEQTLDVQASHAVAPDANLRYYAAKTCANGGLYDAANRAVTDNAVDVISFSWGSATGERDLPQSVRDQFNSIALQAGIQGQSITVSTGDAGTNAGVAGAPTVQFPASSPWLTAVGGTSVGLNQQNKPVLVTGWENSGNTLSGNQWAPQQDADGPFAGGAGGGSSALYGPPDWQNGVVPASLSHGHRALPDVAALADSYTGFLVGRTTQGKFDLLSYGGTSLASPIVAGLAANAQQIRGSRGGLLTPTLYAMKSGIKDVTPVRAGVFTPAMHALAGVAVPGGTGDYLVDFDADPQKKLHTAAGWDTVTGLGSPEPGFVTALAGK
ncbi:S53 family peptidase [Amycolatopsis ultiminotia]|uniref:S53 family peptidase n=2 Tax=Amycolatopsis ultiminotia TaxID=543629 RepID=A0ABP6X3Z0_9PSEU